MKVNEKILQEGVIRQWETAPGVPEVHARLKDQVRQVMPSLGRALDELEQARRSRSPIAEGQIWRALRPRGSERLLRVVDVTPEAVSLTTIQLVDGTPVSPRLRTTTRLTPEALNRSDEYELVSNPPKES